MASRLKGLQTYFKWAGLLAPGWAARRAAHLFLTPAPRAEASTWDAELGPTAQPFSFSFAAHTLEGWRWGQGPRVLLVHGWGGSAESLKAFIAPLVAAGFEVLAIDGPAHGKSPAPRTNVLEFSRFLLALEKQWGPFQGLIGHSFGASSALYSLKLGLAVKKCVLIAPFSKSDHNLDQFSDALQLSPAVRVHTRKRLLRFFGAHRDGWDLADVAGGLHTPILLVHDTQDREVPFEHSVELSQKLPAAELLPTEKLGHRKIIRSAAVVERSVAFLQQDGRNGSP